MPASRLSAWFSRYVAFAARHTGLLLGLFLLLCGGAVALSVKLELHTDMAELLPDSHPAVQALRRIAGRQKSATNLVLLVESQDDAANRRFAEALRPELEKLIPEVFTEIQWRPNTEIAEYGAKWKWLYAELPELERAESLLDRTIAKRKAPLLVDLEGDPEAELKDLRKQLEQRVPVKNDASYFSSHSGNQHFLGVMLWRKRDGLGSLGDHQTMATVKQVIARLNPASFHPSMVVRYTGHIAMAIDEQNAIREDLTVATTICTSLVLLSIYLYFRRIALLWVIGTPAVLGVLLALSLAWFTTGYLNINTAFLISIILGNGINTPIILLARYGEERKAGVAVKEALATALSRTMVATATAMLAAAIAYGCLLVTDFRGFNQFGLIGGAGMMLCWMTTFLLVPPLILFGERLFPGLLTPRENMWRAPFQVCGRLAARRPVMLASMTVLLVFAAVPPLLRYVQDPIEWNINNLRSDETEAQRLWMRMEEMGMGNVGAGYVGNTGVLIVDKPEQADAVAEALRQKDKARGKDHVLAAVRTINGMLPTAQKEKLEILQRVREKIDKHRELMDADEWRDISGFRPPEYLRPLVVDDLPRQVREAFTEVDGQRGRLIGVDADYTNYQDWNGHDLLRLSEALKVEALGKTWIVASAGSIFGGMIETIHRDGKPVTYAALAGVLVLVLASFGPRSAWPVILSMFIGITWMLGGLGGLDMLPQVWREKLHLRMSMKLNFMNFVALPITIGIGTEYATNIWARLREGRLTGKDSPDDVAQIIADTGSAVALCSATTIIGYSSLLLARNQALRSFGLAADLGEVTCLFAALVVLPVVVWLLRKTRRGAGAAAGASK